MLCDFVSASYFNPIIEFLIKNFGYVRGQNLRGAPYDFRKAPSELYIGCCGGNQYIATDDSSYSFRWWLIRCKVR